MALWSFQWFGAGRWHRNPLHRSQLLHFFWKLKINHKFQSRRLYFQKVLAFLMKIQPLTYHWHGGLFWFGLASTTPMVAIWLGSLEGEWAINSLKYHMCCYCCQYFNDMTTKPYFLHSALACELQGVNVFTERRLQRPCDFGFFFYTKPLSHNWTSWQMSFYLAACMGGMKISSHIDRVLHLITTTVSLN